MADPKAELMTIPADLRDPDTFRIAALEMLGSQITTRRAERGTVTVQEDTYSLVRDIAATQERVGEYARALQAVGKYLKGEMESELLAAVGEQDEIPTSGMEVPDLDGTSIKIAKDEVNEYELDVDRLRKAVLLAVLDETRATEPEQDEGEGFDAYTLRYEAWMAEVILAAMETLVDLGKFEPQVSKVRAFAAALSGKGDDNLAAVVRGAIIQRRRYRGIKWDRKQSKRP